MRFLHMGLLLKAKLTKLTVDEDEVEETEEEEDG